MYAFSQFLPPFQDHSPRKSSTQNQIIHPYGARYGTNPIPKFHLPSKVWNKTTIIFYQIHITRFQGVSSEVAYRVIHDELALGEYFAAVSQRVANVIKMDLLCSIWHRLYRHGCLPRQTYLCVRISPRT